MSYWHAGLLLLFHFLGVITIPMTRITTKTNQRSNSRLRLFRLVSPSRVSSQLTNDGPQNSPAMGGAVPPSYSWRGSRRNRTKSQTIAISAAPTMIIKYQ